MNSDLETVVNALLAKAGGEVSIDYDAWRKAEAEAAKIMVEIDQESGRRIIRFGEFL